MMTSCISLLFKLKKTQVHWLDMVGSVECCFVLDEARKKSRVSYDSVFVWTDSATVVEVLGEGCVLRGKP